MWKFDRKWKKDDRENRLEKPQIFIWILSWKFDHYRLVKSRFSASRLIFFQKIFRFFENLGKIDPKATFFWKSEKSIFFTFFDFSTKCSKVDFSLFCNYRVICTFLGDFKFFSNFSFDPYDKMTHIFQYDPLNWLIRPTRRVLAKTISRNRQL